MVDSVKLQVAAIVSNPHHSRYFVTVPLSISFQSKKHRLTNIIVYELKSSDRHRGLSFWRIKGGKQMNSLETEVREFHLADGW